MAVSMNTFWDNAGTVIPGGNAEYVVAEQPIAEYDNWFNYNVVADIQAVIDDVINKFNANTILKADTDNTPAALVVAEQTIVGRKTGNSIAALTAAEVRTLLNVEDGSTADQTNTEIRDAVEAAADSNTFTDNDHTKLNGIEALADITDSTNVAAATAVMDADFSAGEGFMRKTGAGTYVAIKSNMGAAVAPTVNEDSGDGYGVGSQWVDTTADHAYICVDATMGAAVWLETSEHSHGSTHMPGGADTLFTYSLSDDVITDNDASKSTASATYVKVKGITLKNAIGTVRVSFTMTTSVAGDSFGRIYRNGGAVGTERNEPLEQWTTYEEDISGWSVDDELELYCYNNGATTTVKNLRILGTVGVLTNPINDP